MIDFNRIHPLKIHDIDFTVARQIEQCPKTMMLRELIVNAIEAASKAEDLFGRRVEVSGKQVELTGSARKLAIWNTGPGLDSGQLLHICDLAASLRKDMALESNFGMGAKVASLPSNKLGMRYRSCSNGVVSQVLMGNRDGVYGKIPQPVGGEYDEVVDVTDQVVSEGEYSVKEDWTEVVLLGNQPGQDTVADPYDGDPEMDRQWIATGLYHRLYRLPEGVEIGLNAGTHPRDGRRAFKTILDRKDAFGGYEAVKVDRGILIHFFFDPPYKNTSHNQSVSGSFASNLSTVAIVYKGEMYDVRKSQKWKVDAPMFGIPFGAKHISVHIEVPDAFPVRHEPYRRFLQLKGGDQREVSVEDFAELVYRSRPQWLIDRINEFAPKSSTDTSELRKELQQMLNTLRLRVKSPRESLLGEEPVSDGGARGAQPDGRGGEGNTDNTNSEKPDELLFNPLGAKRASISKNMEQPPEFIQLRHEQDIEDHGITGKAAVYIDTTNELFVNMLYPSVGDAKDNLTARYGNHDDPELVRYLATEWAEKIFLGRLGYAVVYAKAKQLNRVWAPEDVKRALDPVCLSLAADGWRDVISSAYHSLGRRLRTVQVSDPGSKEVNV
ncbi:MAG: ATP-binding protein [Pseudomonadota bacterium]